VLDAIERADDHVIAQIEAMPDVVRGGPAVLHAALQERETVAALARASLDGVLDDLPSGRPAVGAQLERLSCELESGQMRGRHDPHVIVACLAREHRREGGGGPPGGGPPPSHPRM
jgi:hypothetical protein